MSLKQISLTLLLFCVGFVNTSAKSYEIPEIDIEVSVNADGTVQITEHLTYSFDGSFTWGEYELPREGYSAITDIQISEDGKYYINENSEKPRTFSVAESDNAIRLRWHYNAKDERRTFTISYTLEGGMTVGPEWSQFFWNYISANRDKSTVLLDISINLPNSIPADSLYGWTRGPEGQIVLQKSVGSYKVRANNIDNDEFAKVRAVFPTDVFQDSKVIVNDNQFTLSQAQQEEQKYYEEFARQQERQAYLADLWEKFNYLIALVSISIFYFFYNRYGKRYTTSRFSAQETIMRPGKKRPAPIGWLLKNRSIWGGLLMATVIDLARRDYFKIEEHLPEEGLWKENKPTFSIKRTNQQPEPNLTRWEQQLLNFIEDQIADDHHKLHELFKGNSSHALKWYSKWKSSFRAYCFDQGWIDEDSYTGVYWNFGIQLVLLISSIAALVFAGPIALISVFTTLIAFFLSFAIIRRTKKGEETYHHWKNYKEGLENAEHHTITSANLDKHYIYAVAFGLGEKEIESIITSSSDATPTFAWLVFHNNTRSASAVASSFSTLSATGTSSFSSAAGGSGASASTAGGGASVSAG